MSADARARLQQCHYIEQAFTEYFDSAALNATRWQDSSLHGLFHCTRGAKLKAGADKYCVRALVMEIAALPSRAYACAIHSLSPQTMALRQNLQVRGS